MGGELSLESTPGQGSRFRLRLPLPYSASGLLPNQVDGNGKTKTTSFPGVKVLVAEDNVINQKLLSYMLENLGVSVQVADDGKSAYQQLEQGEVDLVLMDCQMPEWDGLTATRAVREREAKQGRARLPIIALTANAMTGYDEVCRDAGMDDYLIKPLREEDLVSTLARWLPKRASLVQQTAQVRVETAPENGFDREKLSRICRNDERQIDEMLRLFISSTESLLADLARAVENRDATQTARQAHQIKGAAAYMGAEVMTALASETESLAKVADWPACIAAQEDLEAAFIALRLAMEAS
jgi:CheY-like chemotaxis protein/HPt (histidine-containing phosphotransfer) domain-containing protein